MRPSWETIETAIRRLDRRTHPILILWPTEDEACHEYDQFCERFEVSGGDGVYWLAGTHGGYLQRRFQDPAGGDRDVEIYGPLIEQGFGDRERHICRDVELVVRAARYYAERGGFDPSVPWEVGRRAYLCQRCGAPTLAREDDPQREVCYRCLTPVERKAKFG
ncbi:hypothetical protein C1280_11890 [Gemmata obscuriglobus]|uniref:Uncharacterized protein n=1 Tax=Gemmata obscuriglobus TaxID=114 RepID=A0A2Z3H1M5_9BACT|nr:hypothetical protein C1280_11890 [Gemmata obscuriglobus]